MYELGNVQHSLERNFFMAKDEVRETTPAGSTNLRMSKRESAFLINITLPTAIGTQIPD
jgi:hypothetical protein